jgi:hypothetical protein
MQIKLETQYLIELNLKNGNKDCLYSGMGDKATCLKWIEINKTFHKSMDLEYAYIPRSCVMKVFKQDFYGRNRWSK